MRFRQRATRLLLYLWGAPTTLVGLTAGALTLLSGGQVQVREGTLEFHGGFSRWFLERRIVSASAMTLGHAIIGRDRGCLDRCRAHEQAHVRQVEVWGGAFIPVYLLASLWAWSRGHHYYLDNWFEVDARNACDESLIDIETRLDMIEAVIFDVDGTLIDTVDYHAKAWHWVFTRHGFDFPLEKIRAQIGKGGDQLLPVFLSPDEIERLGVKLQEQRSKYFEDEYLEHIQPFPMVRELFDRIRADGKKIVLASSAQDEELKRYEKIAGIADLIDDSTSSSDSEKSKPHPDIFLAALEKLGQLDPSRAIVVGDTPWDAIAAKKAGLRTIGVLCGGFAEKDLRDAGCVAIFAGPADLLSKYDESPLSQDANA